MFKVVAAIVFVLLAGTSYAYTNPPYEYYPYVAEDSDCLNNIAIITCNYGSWMFRKVQFADGCQI